MGVPSPDTSAATEGLIETVNSPSPAKPDERGPRIRLALVITDLDIGGAERALVELATRLDRSTFDVRVWSIAPAALTRGARSCPALAEAGISVVTMNASRSLVAPRVIRALAKSWRDWRPDVVQTFLFHANILGRVAARRAGVPHIVSGIRVAERRGRWRLWLDRSTDRWVERHVCVSQAVAEFSRTVGACRRKSYS